MCHPGLLHEVCLWINVSLSGKSTWLIINVKITYISVKVCVLTVCVFRVVSSRVVTEVRVFLSLNEVLSQIGVSKCVWLCWCVRLYWLKVSLTKMEEENMVDILRVENDIIVLDD